MAARSLSQENTRVAIYARVSTINHGEDIGLQTRELEQFAQARGWRIVDSYVDEGISGSKDSRPHLNRLMADAHKRRFDAVCVWRFDRFARSVSHLLRAFETFKALGIDFVSFSEQMDTSTPAGKMVFTVLGAVAELERSLIVERVRAGMGNARAKGASVGLRALNYRYKREPPSLAAIYGKEPVFGPRQEIWYLLGHRSEMCWGIPRTTGEGPLSA